MFDIGVKVISFLTSALFKQIYAESNLTIKCEELKQTMIADNDQNSNDLMYHTSGRS